MIIYCNAARSPFLRKTVKSCNVNVVKSLARDKKKKRVESIASRKRNTVSRALSASAIRGGVKHGQMRFINSFVVRNL